jgi:hypothetical protein
MISNQSLTCPKGTSLTFEIDMDTGSDLTGATAQWALAESWFDQAKVYLTKTGVSDGLFIGQDAGIWKITINLAPSDTLDVPSGLLYHDCKVLLQNGDVEDVANGPFILDPSVNVLNTNAPITRNIHGIQTFGSIGQSAAMSLSGSATIWNQLDVVVTNPATFSSDSLTVTSVGSSLIQRANYSIGASDKKYFEVVIGASSDIANTAVGVATAAQDLTQYLGQSNEGIGAFGNGAFYVNDVHVGDMNTFAVGDNVGVAVDRVANKIWFRVNGGFWDDGGGEDPAAGSGGVIISSISGNLFPAFHTESAGGSAIGKFSSSSWIYAAPSGFSEIVGATSTTRSIQATQTLGAVGQSATAAGTLSLPSGALGVWNFDQYSASPSPHVPNSVVSTAVSANLFRASRRMFYQGGSGEWWNSLSLTAADDAASGSDGIVDASTVLGTGGWFLSPQSNGGARTIAAGTYTIACSAKRNTGSDQVYAFTSTNTGSRSPVKTAGASWGRDSYTFTLGSTTDAQRIGICSSDGSTGANIQIRDLELYAGSSDLGPTLPDSHLYLGQTAFDTANIVPSTGAVDLSSGGYGLIQFPDGSASGNFTAQAVISKTINSSTYESFLSRVQSYGQFSAMAAIAYRPAANGSFLVEKFGGEYQGTGLWPLYGDGYHLITYRYDGTNVEIFLDDIRLFISSLSPSFNFRDLFVNLTSSNALLGGLKYHAIAYWNRALSTSEVVTSYSYWKSHAALSGITLSGDTTNRIVMFEGDSRTERNTGFPYIFGGNASPKVFGVDMAVGGSALAGISSRLSSWQANFPTSKNGRKFYVVIGPMGANDLAGYTGATDTIAAQNYANALAAISDTFYSYGADRVIVSTELPQSGATTHNTRRALLNNIIKTAWPGTNAVSIADIASDATMGTDTSFTDHPTDWDDITHPSAAGHALLEPYYRTIINGLP